MRPQPDRSVSEVLQDIVGNLQDLFRSELQLAKTEIAEQLGEAQRPAVMLGWGLLLDAYAVGLLLLASVFALGVVMPMWTAALLVAVGMALVGDRTVAEECPQLP